MTNPTDPRVEAAARALCAQIFGSSVEFYNIPKHLIDGFREDSQAALKAADEAVWQPIESAPKDGTQILAYDSGGSVLVEYLNGNWWSDYGCTFDPTHWQPLPAPPEAP